MNRLFVCAIATLAVLFAAIEVPAQDQGPIREYGSRQKLGDSLSKRSRGNSNPFSNHSSSKLSGSLQRRMRSGGSSVFKIGAMSKLSSSLTEKTKSDANRFNRNQATQLAAGLREKGANTGKDLKKRKKAGRSGAGTTRKKGGSGKQGSSGRRQSAGPE